MFKKRYDAAEACIFPLRLSRGCTHTCTHTHQQALSASCALYHTPQEPALLARSSGAVGSVLGVLRSAFKLGPEGLLQVVEYDPSLLLSHPGQLSASVSRFQAAAARVREWDAEYRCGSSLFLTRGLWWWL
jgi:hypothetical protein